MRDFYSADCCFSRTLNRIDLRRDLPLTSGDMLVLDNRRVLYGQVAGHEQCVMESSYANWGGPDSALPQPLGGSADVMAQPTLDLPRHRDGAADADRIP
jgi:hypothetical protein